MFAIENFPKILKDTWWSSDSFSNPLLLRMIAELFEDNLNFQLTDANLYSIYENFVEKLIANLHEKGQIVFNDIILMGVQTVIESYQKEAVQVVLQICGSDSSNILSMFKNISELPVDKLLRIGLMFEDGTGQLHFVHNSFAEYFVAKFLIDKTFEHGNQSEEESKALAELWVEVLQKPESAIVRKFLEDAIKQLNELNEPPKPSSVITQHISRIDPCIRTYLVEEHCLNLMKMLLP